MKKQITNSYYFRHNINANSNKKLSLLRMKFGAEGYGLWWILVETIYEELGELKYDLDLLEYKMREPKEKIKKVIDYCLEINLLEETSNGLSSKEIRKQINNRVERSKLAKKAANARWNTEKDAKLK